MFTSLEICAGGGGQALGLELAGFNHLGLVEIDQYACMTLRTNRPSWNVIEGDLRCFSGRGFEGIDLFAGGVPCPPFSVAGAQLGVNDERDLFPDALRLIKELKPRSILLENVKGLFDPKFQLYRNSILEQLESFGYHAHWNLINASDFGVPQLRPRTILVGFKKDIFSNFQFPTPNYPKKTVGDSLLDLMSNNSWNNIDNWYKGAQEIAPTLVGGSKKHGGPDLGPTRARMAWSKLGIDGSGIANFPPPKDFQGLPKLTNRMAARIQGFPDSWVFAGGKTAVYRQIGNAFPPPVAHEIGLAIFKALKLSLKDDSTDNERKEKIPQIAA